MSRQRERLLEAACGLVAAGDWAGLRMAHVAAAAGVSRQTAYNEFGSKAELGRAIVEQEIARLLTDLRQEMDATSGGDPVAAVGVAVCGTLTRAEADPLLRSILIGARLGDSLVSHVTSGRAPILPAAIEVLRAYADERWPEVDAEAKDVLIETVLRALISHVLLPLATPAQTADRFARLAARVLASEPLPRVDTMPPRSYQRPTKA